MKKETYEKAMTNITGLFKLMPELDLKDPASQVLMHAANMLAHTFGTPTYPTPGVVVWVANDFARGADDATTGT